MLIAIIKKKNEKNKKKKEGNFCLTIHSLSHYTRSALFGTLCVINRTAYAFHN